jgi:hypothetical protein
MLNVESLNFDLFGYQPSAVSNQLDAKLLTADC